MTSSSPSSGSRTAILAVLRQAIPQIIEGGGAGNFFTFGIPAVDDQLPGEGLSRAAYHEIHYAADPNMPAAFGFLAALLTALPTGAPIFFITSARGFSAADPHGHGLKGLGLDPLRLVFVETKTHAETLWAIEEALKSQAPGAVASLLKRPLDFRTSRRLSLAARAATRPLLLLLKAEKAGASAASTRWQIRPAPAARDFYGLILNSRWRVTLERSRNGWPCEWLMEWDHASHRFSLVAALAGSAVSDDGVHRRAHSG